MARGRTTQALIHQIQMDPRTQARVQIDAEALATYTEAFKNREKFPAVVLFLDSAKKLWIGDGFHRVQAARDAGHKTISAIIKHGSVEDAAWYSLQANRTNGVRFTNADKDKAVRRALEMRPKLSDRAIAEHVGVSNHMVAARRAALQRERGETPDARRETSDGRLFPAHKPQLSNGNASHCSLPNSPGNPDLNVCPTLGYDTVPPNGSAAPAVPPAPVDLNSYPPPLPTAPVDMNAYPPPLPVVAPPPPDLTPRDKVGNALPEGRILEAFRRDGEMVEVVSMIRRAKKMILDRLAAADPLYLDIREQPFTIEIDNAWRWIEHARPYAICPYCWGDNRECAACKGRGWTNEATWKAAPPESKAAGRRLEQAG